MRIFISWSGSMSHKIALALRAWIPLVIQSVEVWVSSEDIQKGQWWATQLAGQLSTCQFGIVCLTPDNLQAEWLHFEAGALSRVVPDSGEERRITALLVGLKESDIPE